MRRTGQPGQDEVTSRMQDAVRLLLLIDGAAKPLPDPPSSNTPADSVAMFETQVALQKLDFWLRNPDYLANALLDRYEETGDQEMVREAERILGSEEPEIRRYPMLRHLFGAYERLDEALSVLAGPGLVFRRREGTINRTRQHNYYVTARGRAVAREMVSTAPELSYYVERVALLIRLTAGKGGTELKEEQYQEPEYADARWRSRIAPISERVRARLKALRPDVEHAG